jgi:hypothetical protein
VQGGLLLVKPLVFRLQYRLSTEEEAIDGVKSDWFGMVAVSEFPGFKAVLSDPCILTNILAVAEARGAAGPVDALF